MFELAFKDVADMQEMNEPQLSYSYFADGPSNKTTWKAECKSEIFGA